jgi:hypothetical protein
MLAALPTIMAAKNKAEADRFLSFLRNADLNLQEVEQIVGGRMGV